MRFEGLVKVDDEVSKVRTTESVSLFIDWVRDECEEDVQLGVGLRQAFRCLPTIFQTQDEAVRLKHCRSLLVAAVGLFEEVPSKNNSSWVSKGNQNIENGAVSNAAITIREASRAVFNKNLPERNTAREIELCLADGFDTLRDITAQHINLRPKTKKFRSLLENYRRNLTKALNEDCEKIAQGGLHSVFSEPLWPHQELIPSPFLTTLKVFENETPDGSIWEFWNEWYQGFLAGNSMDWKLQREVALIPDNEWDKGPKHISTIIETIRTRHTLEHEVANLKEALKQAVPIEGPPHRLHNNPPPEAIIDGQRGLTREVTLIWDQLETLEDEIAKPEPEISKLNVIAKELWGISIRITAYCGSLADIALRESAKALGTTGTKAGIGLFVTTTAAQNEGVQSVAKAIWEFVKTIPPS